MAGRPPTLPGRCHHELEAHALKENRKDSNFTIIGGFQSAAARKVAAICALGFLGVLGFIPGWERRFGLSGSFGLAYIIEAIHRIRNRNHQPLH